MVVIFLNILKLQINFLPSKFFFACFLLYFTSEIVYD